MPPFLNATDGQLSDDDSILRLKDVVDLPQKDDIDDLKCPECGNGRTVGECADERLDALEQMLVTGKRG